MQRCGDADSAIMHGVADEGFHLVELRRGGLNVVIAQHHAPDLCCSDVRSQIDAHALLFQSRKILPQGAPVRSEL